jgi:hypothetical protein
MTLISALKEDSGDLFNRHHSFQYKEFLQRNEDLIKRAVAEEAVTSVVVCRIRKAYWKVQFFFDIPELYPRRSATIYPRAPHRYERQIKRGREIAHKKLGL